MRSRFRLSRASAVGVAMAVAVVAAGCHVFGSAPALPLPWHYVLVLTVDGHTYRVTHHTVKRVGRKVGSIGYRGVYSGTFEIYSVPGVPVSKEVAVDARQGYLKAVRVSALSP